MASRRGRAVHHGLRLAGDGASRAVAQQPAEVSGFDFATDTFAFPNEIRARTPDRKDLYANYCFVLARGLRQFFLFARFDPAAPQLTAAQYVERVRAVAARSPWEPAAPPEARIVIPGYAGLRDFSRAQEAAVKEGLGGRFLTMVHWTNWRVTFPVSQDQQAGVAQEIMTELTAGRLVQLLVTNWPKPELNHGVVAYAYRPTRRGHRVHRVGSERSAGGRPAHVRSARASLRGEPALRYRGGPDPRVPHVLLVVAVTATAPVVEPAAGTPRWYTHRLNRPAVYRAGAVLAGALPRPARLALARTLAQRAAGWFPTERARVCENVARVRPDLDAAARERLVGEVFRHFAICFADLISTNREARPERLLTRVEGDEHLLSVLADGRGLVLVTAHLGNWELGGRLIAARLRRPTHVVVAAEADPGVERFLRGGRVADPVRSPWRSARDARAAGSAAPGRGRGAARRSRARHAR